MKYEGNRQWINEPAFGLNEDDFNCWKCKQEMEIIHHSIPGKLFYCECNNCNAGRNVSYDKSPAAPAILIGGVSYQPMPDPEAKRKLKPPTDKPIVEYCGTRYYLINSARLQMANNLRCFVRISITAGKRLLLQAQTKKENE